MGNRSRGKLVITLLILILTLLGLALFGLALMISVYPAASGPGYDIIRWLEQVIPPYILGLKEWIDYIVQQLQKLIQSIVPGTG